MRFILCGALKYSSAESATREAGNIPGNIFRPLVIYSRYIVSEWREEAVTLIALNSLPLATVMSHSILKCCSVWVLLSACQRACVQLDAM